jgi:hypothetical protein
MTKDVTLSLDDFSRHAVDRFTRLGKGSPADALRTASLYYLRERDADRPGWRVPRFAAAQQAGHALTVELDDATWNALAGEADLQRVSLEALAMHAILYFLADVDSGRVGTQLEDAFDGVDR